MENLFPSLVGLSAGTPTLAAKELAVDVSGDLSIVEDLQTNKRRTVQTWNRLTHLVEPVKAMSGEYVLPDDGALPSFRAAWQTALRKINDPFKGVELVRAFSNPSQGKHSLQIELNKRLYTDASGQDKGPGYDKLNQDLVGLTALLADFAKQKMNK